MSEVYYQTASSLRQTASAKKNEAEIDLVLQQEYVLGSLLHLGLEDAPLEELLPKILREILSVHWMPLTPKGGIFLVYFPLSVGDQLDS
jgi:hypothetical protein